MKGMMITITNASNVGTRNRASVSLRFCLLVISTLPIELLSVCVQPSAGSRDDRPGAGGEEKGDGFGESPVLRHPPD